MARKKAEYAKLKNKVQVGLTDQELKIFEALRRESKHATNSAYGRALFLEKIEKEKQTKLL